MSFQPNDDGVKQKQRYLILLMTKGLFYNIISRQKDLRKVPDTEEARLKNIQSLTASFTFLGISLAILVNFSQF